MTFLLAFILLSLLLVIMLYVKAVVKCIEMVLFPSQYITGMLSEYTCVKISVKIFSQCR